MPTWFPPYGDGAAGVPAPGTVLFSIVLHVRRGDISLGKNPSRWVSAEYIKTVLEAMGDALRPLAESPLPCGAKVQYDVHIATQSWTEKEQEESMKLWDETSRRALGSPVTYHIDADPLETFTHFVECNFLVHGFSSFPGLAAKYYRSGPSASYQTSKAKPSAPATVFDDAVVESVKHAACARWDFLHKA